MTFKNILNRKKILLFVLTILGMTAALTYGKWEVLTLLYGKEFQNNSTIDNAIEKTGAVIGEPKFVKVINYSENKAEVLWVLAGDKSKNVRMDSDKKDSHYMITFEKLKLESGQMEWNLRYWPICTPANGSPSCYFPFYGGIPEE
jgi:hypothetical protein